MKSDILEEMWLLIHSLHLEIIFLVLVSQRLEERTLAANIVCININNS